MTPVVTQGFKEAHAKLRKIGAEGAKVLGAALYQEAEKIMTVSKAVYAPVDKGILRDSGHVQPPEINGKNQVVVVLGYGGPASDYTIPQHERLDYKHTVGQAKYLERPVLSAAPHIGTNVAEFVVVTLRRYASG